MTTRRKPGEPKSLVQMPFTIAIDDRERQAGWSFTGLVDDGNDPAGLIVPTQIVHLKTADYSIVGCESRVVVERKSLSDLYGTLGSGRANFELEHQRMAEIIANGGKACVIIEAAWDVILDKTKQNPEVVSRLNPLSIFRTSISWLVKYNVPWFAINGKRAAELACFQYLKKWWERDEMENLI